MISRGILGILMGCLLAITDVTAMSIMKQISVQSFSKMWMIIVTLIYAAQPWFFLTGMNYTGMTVMNLSWDMISDILVTIVGLFYFREKLNGTKMLAVGFSLIAVFLFSYSSDEK
jgi:multidrug transporter EmrE-like cation transporter